MLQEMMQPNKDIKYEYRTADLLSYSEFDDQLINLEVLLRAMDQFNSCT